MLVIGIELENLWTLGLKPFQRRDQKNTKAHVPQYKTLTNIYIYIYIYIRTLSYTYSIWTLGLTSKLKTRKKINLDSKKIKPMMHRISKKVLGSTKLF